MTMTELIKLRTKTKKRLTEIGHKDETYDDIVERLLKLYHAVFDEGEGKK